MCFLLIELRRIVPVARYRHYRLSNVRIAVRIYLRPSYTRPPVPAFLVLPATIVKRATSREILSGLFTRIVINPSRGPGYRFSNEWPAVFHLALDEIFIVYAGFIISTGNL